MNVTIALCPNCHKEVAFTREANFKVCPECGSMYPITPPPIPRNVRPDSPQGFFGVALGMFLKTLLIMAAVVVVVISIAFAGCVLAITHMH